MPQLFKAMARSIRTRVAPTSRPSQPSVRQAAWVATEQLEARQLFSVSLDSSGFTTVTPEAGDRVIYVSTSGSDSNSGTSPSSPLRTIAAGRGMLRGGTGDQLLLKRGDFFRETVGVWTKGGASADQPMVFGAYGSGARPVVATGKASAMTLGSSSTKVVNNLVIQGIKFWADGRDPSSGTFAGGSGGDEGLRLLAGTNNLLVEDVAVDSYTTNVTVAGFMGYSTNVRIRRCVITDAYNTGGHAQGLYAENMGSLTLEDNVFDHNGWNASVSGAGKTMFNHNAYIKENIASFTARGNIFSNASSHGLQARSGGTIDHNIFIDNPIGMTFGLVNGGPCRAGGVSGTVSNNVFQGGGFIGSTARGYALDLGNISSATVRGNVFTDSPTDSGFAIQLSACSSLTNAGSAVGINNLTIEDNTVYDWTKPFSISENLVPGGSGVYGVRNVTLRNNDFQNIQKATVLAVGADFTTSQFHLSGNRYDSPAGTALVNIGGPSAKWYQWAPGRDSGSDETNVSYAGGAADLDSYAGSIGLGGNASGLISAARGQTEGDWRSAETGSAAANYVLSSFGNGTSSGGEPTPTPDPVGSNPGSTVSITPMADAYVRDGSYANTNYGNAADLQVRKSGSSGYSRVTYLRFDLSKISTISSAQLVLTGSAVQTGSVPMQVFLGSDSWNESTITWNNRPATVGSAVASFTQSVTGTSVKPYAASLTSFLKAQKAAGVTQLTLVVSSPNDMNTAATFRSDEAGASRPQLLVTA